MSFVHVNTIHVLCVCRAPTPYHITLLSVCLNGERISRLVEATYLLCQNLLSPILVVGNKEFHGFKKKILPFILIVPNL